MNCIFCSIIAKEIPSKTVYEDESVLAFYDLNPQAPTHVLIIPKLHIESANGINSENSKYIAHIFEVIPKIANDLGLDGGYRIVSNCGADACQSVKHIHFHILGGTQLSDNMA